MTRNFRVAQRLRLANEHLGWISIHAPRVPILAGAIAKATEDLDHLEGLLRGKKHKRPIGAVADTILRPVEQRVFELVANVESQLWTRGPGPACPLEHGVVVVGDSPRGEDFHQRIAIIDSDIARLRAIAIHPSAHDTLGRAATALFEANWLLDGDPDLEVIASVESGLDLAAWRVRVVQDAVDRFGPAAIVEIVERPSARRLSSLRSA